MSLPNTYANIIYLPIISHSFFSLSTNLSIATSTLQGLLNPSGEKHLQIPFVGENNSADEHKAVASDHHPAMVEMFYYHPVR